MLTLLRKFRTIMISNNSKLTEKANFIFYYLYDNINFIKFANIKSVNNLDARN